MLSNTLDLTVDSTPYTLTRVKESGGTSEYLHRGDGFSFQLKVRNSQQTKGGQVYNVYNMVVTHLIAATPTTLAEERTASFTGRYPDLSDPASSSELQEGLFTLGSAQLAALASGEV
jgi:hypothetical protein